MVFFRHFSIKNKLIFIILSITFVLLVIAFAFAISINITSLKQGMVENVSSVTKTTGFNMVGPLMFNDTLGAQRQFQRLEESTENILDVVLYDIEGNIFAYRHLDTDSLTEPPEVKTKDTYSLEGDYLHIFKIIVYDGEKKGSIYVRASATSLYEKITQTIFMMVVVLIVLFILSFILANWLQNYISKPILNLADITQKIAKENNYSVVLEKQNHDEVGILYDNFNEMLSQIQQRQNENETARKALKDSEEWFKNITSRANDAIIVTNSEGEITFWNNAAEKIFGYHEEEALFQSLKALVIPDGRWDDFQFKFFTTTGSDDDKDSDDLLKSFEFPALKKDKTEIIIEVSASSIMRKSQWNTVAVIRDVTERKEAEKKLTEAKEKAEAADKLKSAFLANMSHEIRTPMNAIIGFSNIISEPDISTDERNEYIKYIKSSSNSLLLLINDLIDVSKIESRQLNITKTKINVHELLQKIYSAFSEEIQRLNKKAIELKMSFHRPVENLYILADEKRVHQIFSHLLRNAVKFTDEGYIEFGYRLIEDTIEFFVKDTGIGISKEKQSIIFDHFRKIEDDNTRLYRGSGLGLSIARSLVHLMDGEIWVESTLSKGSTFYFTTPYVKPPNGSEVKVKKKTGDKFNFSGKTILIAEDEEANYKYLEVTLRRTGALLLWARDGREAVEICKQTNNIDMILMDIKMPNMNGYEATEQIIPLYQKKRIPIIAQTAFTLAEGEGERAKPVFDDYIAKPIQREYLLSTISKHL